jgi:shikimate 5-dehydrogenase
MQPKETELLKRAKILGRSIHYGKYMIESQIDLVGQFLEIW